MKATSDPPKLIGERFSFWLEAKNYDEVRDTNVPGPQLLVVLYLPANPAEWLTCSEESLIARKCAYWLSLYGAPVGEPSGQDCLHPEDQRAVGRRVPRPAVALCPERAAVLCPVNIYPWIWLPG